MDEKDEIIEEPNVETPESGNKKKNVVPAKRKKNLKKNKLKDKLKNKLKDKMNKLKI